MSIISPFPQNTIISLYKGIPWGNDYKEIRLFDSAAQRNSFLATKQVNIWNQCSIVRNGRTIKLTGQFNDYINCNYMSFTNGSFVNEKTFYAFVTSVNYISINAFEIEYEIDWIQSYLFDFKIGECFVEREHVNSDRMGEHTVPENLEIGELVIRNQTLWTEGSGVMIQVQAKNNITVSNISGALDCTVTAGYPIGALGGFEELLNTYNNTPEQVVQLVMITDSMIKQGGGLQKFSKYKVFNRSAFQFAFGGDTYTPVNNKLGTFPYMMFTVDNFGDEVEQFRYEDFGFDTTSCQFTIEGQPTPKPCMQCYPNGYKSQLNSPQNAITYDNFPQCAWQTDTYKQWIAENGMRLGYQMGTTALSTVVNGAAGNYMGAAAGLTQLTAQGLNMYQESQNHRLHSSQLNGSIGNGGLNFSRGYIGFRVTQFAIKPEAAQRIDKYFTRYGYRINTAKVPNIRGRQYFNYVKCGTAVVDGDIAVDAKNAMENALTSGTTFWHTNAIDSIYSSNPIVNS